MISRKDIKGFTLKIFNHYLEVVYIKHWWNIRTIAINKKNRSSNTFYLLDL